MLAFLLVGVGAFVGGVLRYGVAVAMRVPADRFPWHTFTVNVVGCCAAGIATGYFSAREQPDSWQLFVVTGLLGGLTTFSAFGVEVIDLVKAGNASSALIYAASTLVAGLCGVFLGARLFGS